jgi:hypothetical protein
MRKKTFLENETVEFLAKYIFRPFCAIVLLVGLACFLQPNAMGFIPWAWQGGFVIAMLPCGLAVFLDGAISTIQASLKTSLSTKE